ncbi:hypothetical protein GON03_23300 [Nocardioides sp. MAH-18]|uniref:Uncharacterized protein n=1 Tax=Nocardioides agri TaxID=2682843 RepID=A0A6L6XXY6_9ACTN|nr:MULTISPECIES: hypothetical protein [unclassified Nocardioides]MBA2952957.1 hypothetical protein [Nocardioides sp. CGMCC 1.13656]MVQ52119.1 hypothetical protein [Nocardioides sp. MAH-18]
MRRLVALALSCALAVPVLSGGRAGALLPAPERAVGGCPVFPADSWWHADVSSLPVHARSRQWLSHMSTDRDLHPDFGPSYGDGPNYGIPVTVVRPGHRKVRVRFDYADESDRVRYPVGRDTRIEGGRGSDGDKHAIVVDRGSCRLYETWNTRVRDGRWVAGSGAVWSLRSNALRPDGWTSADAAGLPILPGLLRWAEVRSGHVDHAIRFTTDVTSRHYLWPARHQAGSQDSLGYPPMGARFRLRAGFSTGGYSAQTVAVIEAMKTYGLVLADNGSPWFFQGEQNARWSTRLVEELKTIPASAFEAVDTASLQRSPDSAAVDPD